MMVDGDLFALNNAYMETDFRIAGSALIACGLAKHDPERPCRWQSAETGITRIQFSDMVNLDSRNSPISADEVFKQGEELNKAAKTRLDIRELAHVLMVTDHTFVFNCFESTRAVIPIHNTFSTRLRR